MHLHCRFYGRDEIPFRRGASLRRLQVGENLREKIRIEILTMAFEHRVVLFFETIGTGDGRATRLVRQEADHLRGKRVAGVEAPLFLVEVQSGDQKGVYLFCDLFRDAMSDLFIRVFFLGSARNERFLLERQKRGKRRVECFCIVYERGVDREKEARLQGRGGDEVIPLVFEKYGAAVENALRLMHVLAVGARFIGTAVDDLHEIEPPRQSERECAEKKRENAYPENVLSAH